MQKDKMDVISMAKNDLPIGINAIILNSKNEVLLGLRAGHRGGAGTWGLIGGKAKTGESIETCCVREVLEETGLKVKKEDLEVVNIFTTQSTATTYFYQIGILVKKYAGTPKNLEPNKCDELKFFPLNALPENLFMGTKGNIDLFKSGKFYDRNVNYSFENVK